MTKPPTMRPIQGDFPTEPPTASGTIIHGSVDPPNISREYLIDWQRNLLIEVKLAGAMKVTVVSNSVRACATHGLVAVTATDGGSLVAITPAGEDALRRGWYLTAC